MEMYTVSVPPLRPVADFQVWPTVLLHGYRCNFLRFYCTDNSNRFAYESKVFDSSAEVGWIDPFRQGVGAKT